MSSRVTSVPALQWPLEAGPGWHAWVNMPATITSPFTITALETLALAQGPPNHCWHTAESVVPAKMFGVHVTADGDTTPDSGTAAPAGPMPNRARRALITRASG